MKTRMKWISLLLAVVLAVSALPLSVFAAEEKVYVKEVRISTAADEATAKLWLTANGYTVLDFNLNQKSNGDAVYLGYTTTTNPKEAITDMAVMQMDGGYSFAEYEELLEEQREDINDMIGILEVTLDEARANLANGYKNAQDAKKILNFFTEEDLELVQSMTPEELTDYFPEDYQEYASLYIALGEYKYARGTARDFFMQDPNEIALEDIYPILAAMTPGQRTICAFVGFETLVYFSQATEETALEYFNDCRAQFAAYNLDPGVSVYYGVDRSLFNEGGIALTNESLRESATTGDTSWFSQENIDENLLLALKIIGGATKLTGKIAGVTGKIVSSKAGKAAKSVQMLEESMGANAMLLAQERRTMLAMQDEMFAKYNVASMDEFKILAQTDDLIMADYQRLGTKKISIEGAADTFEYVAKKHADEAFEVARAGAMKKFTVVQKVAAGIGLIITGIKLGVKLYNYYHPDFTVIPRIIVDEIATENDYYYVRYYAVLDQDGEFADLNAWKGSRWNALYTTKDSDGGDPILASGLMAKLDDNSMPTADSYGVHYFGETGACDVNRYLLRSRSPEIYMFFTRDHSLRATASAFSRGTVITFASIGILGGIAIGSVATVGAGKLKKKKEDSAQDN